MVVLGGKPDINISTFVNYLDTWNSNAVTNWRRRGHRFQQPQTGPAFEEVAFL